MSENAKLPSCLNNKTIKYFPSDSEVTPTFLIRLSDYKYDKHLFTFNEEQFRPEYFPTFCINLGINSTLKQFIGTVAVTCQSSLNQKCSQSSCIRSCCPPRHVFRLNLGKCVPMQKNKFNQYKSLRDVLIGNKGLNNYYRSARRKRKIFLYGIPKCDSELKSKYITKNFTGYNSTISGRLYSIRILDTFLLLYHHIAI